MKQILIIEDDLNVLDPLCLYLKNEGFAVLKATSLAKAHENIQINLPDLFILDWNLPDGQGIDFLKECRSKGIKTPFIFLTAKGDVLDKVLGLEVGANDYMTKPFEPRELLARIRVLLRDLQKTQSLQNESMLLVNGIKMNLMDRTVEWKSSFVELTKKEFDLLKLFLENPGKVFNRDELLNLVWGYDHFPNTRTVDNHILKLRQTFGENLFETLRGVGYRMKKEN